VNLIHDSLSDLVILDQFLYIG